MISRRRLTYQTAILGSSRCTPSIPRVPGLPDFRGSPLFMLHRSQRTTKFGMVTHGEGCVSGDASLHLHKCVARFVSDAEFLSALLSGSLPAKIHFLPWQNANPTDARQIFFYLLVQISYWDNNMFIALLILLLKHYIFIFTGNV